MAKAKVINFTLIKPLDGIVEPEPYKVLRAMREKHHSALKEARIALAWRRKLKHDRDGHLILGRCMKASDLQRELAEWDFVILLNEEVWNEKQFTADKKRALIDHELCHAAVSRDKYGAPRRDDRGRQVFRIRRHDIEEFQDVVARHGCYKSDLEAFAKALLEKKDAPLIAAIDEADKKSKPRTEK